MSELTQECVRSLFDYRDGELYWKVSRGNGMKIGDLAGTVRTDGYRAIGINGKLYLAHRLIFLYHYGYIPKEIDHIASNPSNNNISNLREATRAQNHMNQKKSKSYNGKPTSSKFKGVSWNKASGKWQANIRIGGKLKNLGYYNSEIEAAKAYDKAGSEAFGEFAKVNID